MIMRNIIFALCSLVIFSLITSCEKDDVSKLKDNLYVRRNGADIPTYVYGNGSEKVFLVFLHGGPGDPTLFFRSSKSFKKLEEDFALVYFEQRGQGNSQGHYSKTENNIWEAAKDVKALALILRKKYGEDIKLFLMGYSWGGALGFSTLLIDNEAQGLFRGWIDVSGCHDIPMSTQNTINLINEVGQEQITLGNSVDNWTGAIQRVNKLEISTLDDVLSLTRESSRAQNRLRNDNITNNSEEISLESKQYLYLIDTPITTIINAINFRNDINNNQNFFVDFSLTDSLHKITLPTLFIWGKYDMQVPSPLADTAFNRISSDTKKIVILDRSDHAMIAQQPDEFVTEVIDFINENK
jgi:pimeloyl-ACP methyl ester carboxylesterase